MKISRETTINLFWAALNISFLLFLLYSSYTGHAAYSARSSALATQTVEHVGSSTVVETNCPREGFYQTIDDLGVCIVSDTPIDTVAISISSISDVAEIERSVKTHLYGNALQAKPDFACPNGSLIDYINHQASTLTVCSSKNIRDSGYALDVILDNKHYIKVYPLVEHLTIDP